MKRWFHENTESWCHCVLVLHGNTHKYKHEHAHIHARTYARTHARTYARTHIITHARTLSSPIENIQGLREICDLFWQNTIIWNAYYFLASLSIQATLDMMEVKVIFAVVRASHRWFLWFSWFSFVSWFSWFLWFSWIRLPLQLQPVVAQILRSPQSLRLPSY